MFKYVLLSAVAQCGTEPPYNCLNVPVRMQEDTPQIKIAGDWIDFPKDGPRPEIKTYYGLPCAGIASDWRVS